MHKRGILTREAAAREGNELAQWDEYLDAADRAKLPAWLDVERLKKTLLASLKTPRARGRHSSVRQEQEQIFTDFVIFELVNEWREEQWQPKAKDAKVKPFPWRRAYAAARKDVKLSLGLKLSAEAIRAAHRRAAKRHREGFYASELFLRTVRITLPPPV